MPQHGAMALSPYEKVSCIGSPDGQAIDVARVPICGACAALNMNEHSRNGGKALVTTATPAIEASRHTYLLVLERRSALSQERRIDSTQARPLADSFPRFLWHFQQYVHRCTTPVKKCHFRPSAVEKSESQASHTKCLAGLPRLCTSLCSRVARHVTAVVLGVPMARIALEVLLAGERRFEITCTGCAVVVLAWLEFWRCCVRVVRRRRTCRRGCSMPSRRRKQRK